jgi:hypothetical protein
MSPKYIPTGEGMKASQRIGYSILRNMAICIGMLVIDSITLLLDNVLRPNRAMYVKVYNLAGAGEPVGISILLWTLRQQVFRVVMDEMSATSNKDSFDLREQRVVLFQAQQAFYTKVGGVFKSAATAKLISPWIVLIKTSVLFYKDWCSIENPSRIVMWLAACST